MRSSPFARCAERTESSDRFVPGITINVAFALMIASIGMFVSYIHRVARSIRVSTIINSIGDETRDAIDRIHREDQRHPDQALMPDFPGHAVLIGADEQGTVRSVETANLLELAEDADGYIKALPRNGRIRSHGDAVDGSVVAQRVGRKEAAIGGFVGEGKGIRPRRKLRSAPVGRHCRESAVSRHK